MDLHRLRRETLTGTNQTTMNDRNTDPKPEDVPQQQAGEDCPSASGSRFFIAQPGDPVKPHSDLQWVEWEVGDHRGQDRICLTSCKRKAELIRNALEAFHSNAQAMASADEKTTPKETTL